MGLLGTAGVCYGMNGAGLPRPAEVVRIYQKKGIQRMRLYSPNIEALDALRNSNIEVVLGVANTELEGLASNGATTWVRDFVTKYIPAVKFKYIAVGNQVSPGDDNAKYLLPAMKNLQNAIYSAKLPEPIAVSTAIGATGVLGKFKLPSTASFVPEFANLIEPIIEFMVSQTKPAAPVLMVDAHPYLSYIDPSSAISLEYALFKATEPVQDSPYDYYNLFDAIVDAVRCATCSLNANAASLEIVVSATGWPSEGGKEATGANQVTYINNLVDHVPGGTPRLQKPLETYVFAMFDESMNKDPEYERHWGINKTNGEPKYPSK